MGQIQNKLQDGEFKPNHIVNYIKCEYSRLSNYKIEIVRLDLKNKAWSDISNMEE